MFWCGIHKNQLYAQYLKSMKNKKMSAQKSLKSKTCIFSEICLWNGVDLNYFQNLKLFSSFFCQTHPFPSHKTFFILNTNLKTSISQNIKNGLKAFLLWCDDIWTMNQWTKTKEQWTLSDQNMGDILNINNG